MQFAVQVYEPVMLAASMVAEPVVTRSQAGPNGEQPPGMVSVKLNVDRDSVASMVPSLPKRVSGGLNVD